MVSQIDLIVIWLCSFALVGEVAGAGVFIHISGVAYRHDGELAVVIDPWRRLVGLLEASDPVLVVPVGPSVAHPSSLRGPEVHSPWQRHSGVGVAR